MSHRSQQVAQELLKAIGIIIQKELPMDRFGLITVTDVVVTTGLEHARIYISAFQQAEQAVEQLNNRTGKIKHELHDAVMLRKIPQLEFIADLRPERAEKLEEIIEEHSDE